MKQRQGGIGHTSLWQDANLSIPPLKNIDSYEYRCKMMDFCMLDKLFGDLTFEHLASGSRTK